MKEFRLPFKYFRDAETRLLEKKQPDVADPEAYYHRMLWKCPDGRKFLLNNRNRELIRKHGSFKPPYHYIDRLKDFNKDGDAFIFCPGPSMSLVDPNKFKGKLTIAVNSAGFKINPMFWCIFESNYLKEVFMANIREIPKGRRYAMTARCAVRWRAAGRTNLMSECYIPQFEEARNMPHRTPGVTSMGAITLAWYFGCTRIFLIGLDLSRPNKQPYIAGVPHSKFGATNPFKEQVLALKQVAFPGVDIYNASPHSSNKLPFIGVAPQLVEDAACDSDTVRLP